MIEKLFELLWKLYQQSLEVPGTGGSDIGFGLISSKIVIFVDRKGELLGCPPCLNRLEQNNVHITKQLWYVNAEVRMGSQRPNRTLTCSNDPSVKPARREELCHRVLPQWQPQERREPLQLAHSLRRTNLLKSDNNRI